MKSFGLHQELCATPEICIILKDLPHIKRFAPHHESWTKYRNCTSRRDVHHMKRFVPHEEICTTPRYLFEPHDECCTIWKDLHNTKSFVQHIYLCREFYQLRGLHHAKTFAKHQEICTTWREMPHVKRCEPHQHQEIRTDSMKWFVQHKEMYHRSLHQKSPKMSQLNTVLLYM